MLGKGRLVILTLALVVFMVGCKGQEAEVDTDSILPQESSKIVDTEPDETWTPQKPVDRDDSDTDEDEDVYIHTKSPNVSEIEEEYGEKILDPLEGFTGHKIESETTIPSASTTYSNYEVLYGTEYMSDCDIEVLDTNNWGSIDKIVSNPGTYNGQMIKIYGKYYTGKDGYGSLFGNNSSSEIKVYSEYDLDDSTTYLIVGEICNLEDENSGLVPYIDCYTIYSAY